MMAFSTKKMAKFWSRIKYNVSSLLVLTFHAMSHTRAASHDFRYGTQVFKGGTYLKIELKKCGAYARGALI